MKSKGTLALQSDHTCWRHMAIVTDGRLAMLHNEATAFLLFIRRQSDASLRQAGYTNSFPVALGYLPGPLHPNS